MQQLSLRYVDQIEMAQVRCYALDRRYRVIVCGGRSQGLEVIEEIAYHGRALPLSDSPVYDYLSFSMYKARTIHRIISYDPKTRMARVFKMCRPGPRHIASAADVRA